LAGNWADHTVRLFGGIAIGGIAVGLADSCCLPSSSPGTEAAFLAATASLTLLMLLELENVTTYSFPPQGEAKSLLKELA